MWIFKGFKFGMILQLAIGPVCLYIFKVGGNRGFFEAETAVLGVTLIDALYILLAIFGTTSFIEKERVKRIFKILGALIIIVFGLNIIVSTLGVDLLPNIELLKGIKLENSFLAGILLTASNPLTILFLAGVFSAKIAEEKLIRKDVYLFGVGSVLATLFFLTFIAVIGSFTRYFLPSQLISILNAIVGLVLTYFGVRLILNERN